MGIKRLLGPAVFVLLCLFVVAWPRVVKAADDLFAITKSTNDALQVFYDFTHDESISDYQYLTNFGAKADELIGKLNDAKARVAALPTDKKPTKGLDNFDKSLGDFITATTAAKEAVAAGDEDAYKAALGDMDTASELYNGAVDDMSKSLTGFTGSDTESLYLAVTGLSVLLALSTFGWAYYKREGRTEADKTARKRVAMVSLVPLTGSLITLGTYTFTSDGTYYIAWGPVLFGVIYYVKEIFNYQNNKKRLQEVPTADIPPVIPPATPSTPINSGGQGGI